MSVTKSGPETAKPGDVIQYTIEVRNLGPDTASTVTLTDALPGGTTFKSLDAPANWSCSTPNVDQNGTVVCNAEGFTTANPATFTLRVQLNPEAAPGATFTNVATVNGSTPDPNEENDSSTAVTIIPAPSADLRVNKSADKQQALAGADVTYTIVVTNEGPDPATSAALNDTLPGDMTFVSLTQMGDTAWTCSTPTAGNGGSITCNAESVAAGSQTTFQLVGHIPNGAASGTGYFNAAAVSSDNDPNDENNSSEAGTEVFAAAPSLTTTASASVPIGGSIFDTASLTGGSSATGSITFTAYGPNQSSCGGPAVFTSTVPVTGDNSYKSASFTPAVAGTYRFIATYSGDQANIGVATGCSDPNESVDVTLAAPTLTTAASSSVAVGNGTISDRATLANGAAPSGTITFNLYGPNNSECGGTPIFTSSKSVSGNGNYDSATFAPSQSGTYNWVASYSGDANNRAVAGACRDANESVDVSPAPTPTPAPTPSDVLNLSTRERVQQNDSVAIGGFIITGSADKKIVILGLGPSLQDQGINDYLPDPLLELRASDGSVILKNDNWQDDPSQAQQIRDAHLEPKSTLESGIAFPLPAGRYTAIESGKGNNSGVGLVAIYDVDSAAASGLANISTRGLVGSGENVMIGGFTLGRNSSPANVIVRAIGPSLADYGITNPLADPVLDLYDGNGTKFASNDNWDEDSVQASEISQRGLAPKSRLEAAYFATLSAGRYTVIVTGKDPAGGVGLVEIYRVQ